MCPDVDHDLARPTQLRPTKAPVKRLLPLTATGHNHAERANPSGKTDANLIDTLGSTNSSSNNVHLKPFSTSILSFLN
jgi:flagellar basal body rod protein FlgB